jgi:hypothetical protein
MALGQHDDLGQQHHTNSGTYQVSVLFTIYTFSSTLPKPATSSGAILDIPIQFTISCTNQYVNRTNAPLSQAIESGVPYY